MTNADKFKEIFGLYATELWVMLEVDFLKWLNADYTTELQTKRGRAMKMTPKEFAEKMQLIVDEENTELGHIEMDNLMCELLKSLGYEEGAEIFDNALKWYS